jgi:polar amino acid transport system substrate-binding protein
MNPTHSPLRRKLLLAGLTGALAACNRQSERNAAAPVDSSPKPRPQVVDDDPTIRVNAVLLPGVIESATQGPFIELIRALDVAYPGGNFQIEAYPLARVLNNLKNRDCDIAFPDLHMQAGDDTVLPYRHSSESVGTVSFVLYVNSDKPLTHDMIERARNAPKFPYFIEAPKTNWGFPVLAFHTLESAFKKVSAGRIDALLWAQEEADYELRRLGLKNIRRVHFGDFNDVFMLNRDARGDFADRVLMQAIRDLRRSGRLEMLYRHIHSPFVAWQPSDNL